MVYQGIVRQGKIELPTQARLPDGTVVRVEICTQEWIEQWEKLAEDVAKDWHTDASAVDTLLEMRR